MDLSRQTTGALGESLAEGYLKKRGYLVLCRNFRSPIGEIDLIAKESGSLVFVEVKSRLSLAMGHPAESVTRLKRRHIVKAAQFYLKRYRLFHWPCRFDVLAVYLDGDGQAQFELIQNAFGESLC